MVPLKYNFARKASHDYVWKSLEKKMQHNRKYRNLGWWAAHWLFYNLGRIQNDGNLNDGFWLIQKLDCFANKLKNPIILWSKLCIIWLFVYDYLLKLQLFSDFSPVCRGYMALIGMWQCNITIYKWDVSRKINCMNINC